MSANDLIATLKQLESEVPGNTYHIEDFRIADDMGNTVVAVDPDWLSHIPLGNHREIDEEINLIITLRKELPRVIALLEAGDKLATSLEGSVGMMPERAEKALSAYKDFAK